MFSSHRDLALTVCELLRFSPEQEGLVDDRPPVRNTSYLMPHALCLRAKRLGISVRTFLLPATSLFTRTPHASTECDAVLHTPHPF